MNIWKKSHNYYIRSKKMWAVGESGRIIFTIFFKYFYYRLFLKWVKDFLILYDKTYIRVLLIFKTLEATFKGVRIKSERGAGRPLGQHEPTTKI